MRCSICGSGKRIEKHHIFPKVMNGTAQPDNIMTVCRNCHKNIPNYGNRSHFNGDKAVFAVRVPKSVVAVIKTYAWYHRKSIGDCVGEIVEGYFTREDEAIKRAKRLARKAIASLETI